MPRQVAPEEMTGTFGDEATFKPPTPPAGPPEDPESRGRRTAAASRAAYTEGARHRREGPGRRDQRPDEPDDVYAAYGAGYDDQEAAERRGRGPGPLGREWGAPDDWAGVVLGAIAYALVLSYVRYGWAGPKAWFAAKFMNAKPTVGAGTSTPKTSGGTPSPYGVPAGAPGSVAGGSSTPPPPAPPGPWSPTTGTVPTPPLYAPVNGR